ncbi:MAG: energy-coupling factor ABC transporter permease [Methylophilaceae bacterium]|nr:energy-coupling factor ABC transporter permease [Methylophilaceae bacterium]
MNFPDHLLPATVIWPANLLAVWLLYHCIRHAPWRYLAKPGRQHLWMAACVGLMVLWSIKTGIKPGLTFHVLGSTLLTLMFGPRLAIVALAVVLAGVTLAGAAGWQSLGINLLLMGGLPVLFSYVLYSQAYHKLPHHVFIYIFVDAFVAAGLSILLLGVVDTLLLSFAGVYSLEYLRDNYLPYFILMGWSEALLTGMAVTLMVAYRPEWLVTFSDKLYLKGK